ncbi:hypothetical protein [Rhodococcus sp. IEGM 1408]|uniref:hypothetical protein n=1 Tax=Rhodococcus sp. IEGM 1408 TaxID=3082220 RepID=UPI0029548F98|nr:hypothetical protein [Rhodococcus sp. IEGM 1408]MDV8002849.1 hypothetical protein [Rhodococcus sp. IEGM 1408]
MLDILITSAPALSEQIIAVGENLSPQAPPGAEEKVNTALAYFMWGCIAIGIMGVMGAGAWFIMARRSGNSEEVQSTIARIVGGSLLIILAGPIVNALVS